MVKLLLEMATVVAPPKTVSFPRHSVIAVPNCATNNAKNRRGHKQWGSGSWNARNSALSRNLTCVTCTPHLADYREQFIKEKNEKKNVESECLVNRS